ncbi:facilitated trehalose transporter Tret1-like [Diabrotica virgifera virgifera]|uniref:Facilitated trehalose transporter Tret1-like n=1 Tax=Diabrotica virgifera virgifera TaxID=50390 RepID=A0A6P7FWX6_DIAVI|nr:facilitated trehalose transporter Tret1-like [Diabrotica virgifera virgifera]
MDSQNVNNYFLYFSAIAANMFFVSSGTMLVWNSPVLPKLQSNNTIINPLPTPITIFETSTITMMYPLGSTIGSLLIGKIPDIIGRKKTLTCLSFVVMVSFIALSFANEVYFFFIILPILSANLAAGYIVIPTYVSEIAEDHNRGNLGTMMSFGYGFGQLYAYLIGATTSYRLFCLLCAFPPFLVLLCSLFIPESPIYATLKGRREQALIILKKLRKSKPARDVEIEYNEKEQFLLNNTIGPKISFKSFFLDRAVRKGIALSIAVFVMQKVAANYLVLSFLGTLLNDADSNLSGDKLAVLVQIIKIIAAFVVFYAVEKKGRRFLFLLGTSLCGVALFGLGSYFYFQHNGYYLNGFTRLMPVFLIIFFLVSYTLSLSSIPSILASELLPNELRSLGLSIALLFGNICLIAISFSYPIVAKYLGVHYCMYTFSCFCFIGFSIMYFVLPETRGKSFEEIRNILNG